MNRAIPSSAGENLAAPASSFDIDRIRSQFPILDQQVHGFPLVYFDNAATTQKPASVIETIDRYYRQDNANVHRGVHSLSERATEAYEAARIAVKEFINADSTREIIFVRGTTEAINLVAQSYARPKLGKGDEILISEMEHHSNIVPWQLVCEQTGASLKVIPIDSKGQLCLDQVESLISARTRLLAITHVSNALGTINPVAQLVELAHARSIPVLLDGAQATAHLPVDVQALDVDFYAFSAHKMYGPTGVGVLYGKQQTLEAMPPYQGGGDMISMVKFDKTLYNDLPYKFEAGTPNIAGVIGFAAALRYLEDTGLDTIQQYEGKLLSYGLTRAVAFPGLRLIGTAAHKVGILSFVLDDVHPHDVGTILDRQGIAVRTGHHCSMPIMDHFKIPATVRASFAIYNTVDEVDRLFEALDRVRKVFS
jgi:cysteine desulfurase/selenocysteine lyase